MLVDRSLRDVIAAFASPRPTPGGGSASALASAVGASLLLMISAMQKTRSGSEDDRAALDAAQRGLDAVHRQLIDAIDADSAAYDAVVAAYKRPKSTEPERAARTTAIQQALGRATEVPLRVMRLSAAALTNAASVAAHGNPAAASDVGTAVALLRAGADGALLNVEANIGGLADQAYVDAVREEARRLRDEIGDRR